MQFNCQRDYFPWQKHVATLSWLPMMSGITFSKNWTRKYMHSTHATDWYFLTFHVQYHEHILQLQYYSKTVHITNCICAGEWKSPSVIAFLCWRHPGWNHWTRQGHCPSLNASSVHSQNHEERTYCHNPFHQSCQYIGWYGHTYNCSGHILHFCKKIQMDRKPYSRKSPSTHLHRSHSPPRRHKPRTCGCICPLFRTGND